MNYYKVLLDTKNLKSSIACLKKEIYNIDRYDVEKGIEINNWDSRNCFYYEPSPGKKFTDYLDNLLGWFIISSKFKKVLQENQVEGIQYLPINIYNSHNGQALEGYTVANITNLVDALDLTHTPYNILESNDKQPYYSVVLNGYVLRGEEINGNHIFRLKNSFIGIFVSEFVKQIIEENEITGCSLLKVKVI